MNTTMSIHFLLSEAAVVTLQVRTDYTKGIKNEISKGNSHTVGGPGETGLLTVGSHGTHSVSSATRVRCCQSGLEMQWPVFLETDHVGTFCPACSGILDAKRKAGVQHKAYLLFA